MIEVLFESVLKVDRLLIDKVSKTRGNIRGTVIERLGTVLILMANRYILTAMKERSTMLYNRGMVWLGMFWKASLRK